MEARPPPVVVGTPSMNMMNNATGQYVSSLSQQWNPNLLNSMGRLHPNMSTLAREYPLHEKAGPSNPPNARLNYTLNAQNRHLFDSYMNKSSDLSTERDVDRAGSEPIYDHESEEEEIIERLLQSAEEEREEETEIEGEAGRGGVGEGRGGEEEQPYRSTYMPNIPYYTSTDEPYNLSVTKSSNSRVYQHGGVVSVGQTFADKKSLIKAVDDWSFRMNRQYIVLSSKKNLWYARCRQWKSGTCAWKLRGIQTSSGIWKVSKCPVYQHSCSSHDLEAYMKFVTTDMIADLVFNKVVHKPSYPVKSIIQDVMDRYHVTVKYGKAWNACQCVIKEVFGGFEESYSSLPNFFLELCQRNPGTIVEWVRGQGCAEPNTWEFKCVFWTFSPCIYGFRHCIPVISVHGTHLYRDSCGTLLIATSIDGNGNNFLLAFAIVDEEDNDCWNWFLGLLRAHVIRDAAGVCIISDRHKSIHNVFQQPNWQEPIMFHRYCLRHIQDNFMTKFADEELRNLCYRAGEAITTKQFEGVMEHIERLLPQAAQWLRKIPLEKWTQSHDGGHRFGVMNTKMSEYVNTMLKGTRHLPITALVQEIWKRTVFSFTRGQKRVIECVKGKMAYPKKIHNMLTHFDEQCRLYSLEEQDRSRGVFECYRHDSPHGSQESIRYVIELDRHVCSCGEWQSKQYPCIHAVKAAKYHQAAVGMLIHSAYLIEEYSATYIMGFMPLREQKFWPSANWICKSPNICVCERRAACRNASWISNEVDEDATPR